MSTTAAVRGENPLKHYCELQSLAYTAETVSKEALSKMTVAAFMHGDACETVIWSPNWAEVRERSRMPSGFQFTVDRNSHVAPSLFDNLYAVQMAFPLDAGAKSSFASSGVKAGDAHFIDNRDVIAASLNAAIPNQTLGETDGGNFCGIFATETRTPTGYEKKFYAAARFSSADIDEKIRAKLLEAASPDRDASLDYLEKLKERNFNDDPAYVGMAPPHTTWRDLFVNDHEMFGLREQQSAACAALICQTIKASGLGPVVAGKASGQANIDAVLHSPALVQTLVNDVDHIKASRHLAYLSDMGSINNAANGFLFRETPQLGLTIYSKMSPPMATASGAQVIGLPTSVGQLRSAHAHAHHASLDRSDLAQRAPFVWDASGGAIHNVAMSTTLYRQSASAAWINAATKFGFNHIDREALHLKPVVVKMAANSCLPPKK